MSEIAKYSEILFLWDAKMTNPNGDMLNDNAPRYDESDRKAIVSDVRVKRTIRDDLQYRKSQTIFVNNAEQVQSAETRFAEVKKILGEADDKKAFLSCIDNRLFGGVAPKSNIQIIGAVQFSWAKSLNETETIMSQGTGAFGKDGSGNKTFRTDNYIPYGLFDELVKLDNKDSDQIRSIDECELNFTAITRSLKNMSQKIEKVVIFYDDSLREYVDQFKEPGLEIDAREL